MPLAPWDPPQECSDPNFAWLGNSAGQTACELWWNFVEPCLTTLGNKKPPLDSSDCACSTIPYSLLYACGLCSDRKDLQITFGEYQGTLDCENTAPVGQYSGPTFGVDIPSWAYQQLTGSDAFDVTKAQEVARNPPPGGASPSSTSTQVPQPTSAPTLPTPSEPSQPTAPSAQTSEGLPSSSTLSEESVSQSGPATAPGGQPMTNRLPGGGPGASRGATFATPSPSAVGATTGSSAYQVGPIAGIVIGAVVIVIPALVVALLLLRRRRRAISVSPFRRTANQVSIASVAPAPFALSAASRPPSLVPGLQFNEGGVVDASLPVTRMRLADPDNPSTYPPSPSEIAPSKTWSDSSLPPYSP
ncbi:hypothetical protein PYCCODRAFT_475658 [Trametes coccinea BRFM310]|uniref:Uncharacterized protein n=1 Tax=Trametes coccinea (strain BRFM310) TaxID=1353009 RepID=A0A1Y2IMA3_TRAC3|nr:hypothetical protein PYCCODRAFT_475658 [Trametes coccinea BRFM310]